MKRETKAFTVIRAKLEPRPKLAEVSRAEPIVTDKGKRAEEKRREKWARQIASEAFKRR